MERRPGRTEAPGQRRDMGAADHGSARVLGQPVPAVRTLPVLCGTPAPEGSRSDHRQPRPRPRFIADGRKRGLAGRRGDLLHLRRRPFPGCQGGGAVRRQTRAAGRDRVAARSGRLRPGHRAGPSSRSRPLSRRPHVVQGSVGRPRRSVQGARSHRRIRRKARPPVQARHHPGLDADARHQHPVARSAAPEHRRPRARADVREGRLGTDHGVPTGLRVGLLRLEAGEPRRYLDLDARRRRANRSHPTHGGSSAPAMVPVTTIWCAPRRSAARTS